MSVRAGFGTGSPVLSLEAGSPGQLLQPPGQEADVLDLVCSGVLCTFCSGTGLWSPIRT